MVLEKLITSFTNHINPYIATGSGLGMGLMTTYFNIDDISNFSTYDEALIAGIKQFGVTFLSSGYTGKLTQKLSEKSPYQKSILYPTSVSTICAGIAHYSPILDTPNLLESVLFVTLASIGMISGITAYERDDFNLKTLINK